MEDLNSKEVLAQHAKSFNLAGKFLPKRSLNDAATIYHFCRWLDDSVDENLVSHPKAFLKNTLSDLKSTQQKNKLIQRYLITQKPLGIGSLAGEQLVKGMLWDITENQIKNEQELLTYCYQVASSVGLMMSSAIGITNKQAFTYAIDLGIAMQLTNITRDIYEDSQKGRLYIPLNWLQQLGYTLKDIQSQNVPKEAVYKIVERLLNLADSYYESAKWGLHYIPFKTRFAIIVASRVYRSIGVYMKYKKINPLYRRSIVPKPIKLLWIIESCFYSLRPSVLGIFRKKHDNRLHEKIRHLPFCNS